MQPPASAARNKATAETKVAEAMLGEGSGPNKRAHVEEVEDASTLLPQAGPSLRQQGKRP